MSSASGRHLINGGYSSERPQEPGSDPQMLSCVAGLAQMRRNARKDGSQRELEIAIVAKYIVYVARSVYLEGRRALPINEDQQQTAKGAFNVGLSRDGRMQEMVWRSLAGIKMEKGGHKRKRQPSNTGYSVDMPQVQSACCLSAN